MKRTMDETLVAAARALGPVIREHAAEGERQRRLARPVIEGLVKAGLTRMFLPKSLGGLETDPLTHLRVVEEIAGFDAAAGWRLMVESSGNVTFAQFPAETVEELMKDPNDCLGAAAIVPPIEAREVEGGYRVTGRRPYASGISDARYVMVTALIMDASGPRMVGGAPVMLAVALHRKDVEIVDTWYGLGLRASDSNDVSVKDVFVPKAYSTQFSPVFEPNRHFRGPLYRMPVMGSIVLPSIPAIALALGRRAIDEVRALSSKRVPMATTVPIRDRGVAQAQLGRAEAMLRSARALMYDEMEAAWDRAVAGEPSTLQQKADLMLAAAHAAQTGTKVVDMMYGSGGSSAVFDGSPLQKLFRDASVVRQHGFVCAGRYETFAQVFLGLEPDLPFVHF